MVQLSRAFEGNYACDEEHRGNPLTKKSVGAVSAAIYVYRAGRGASAIEANSLLPASRDALSIAHYYDPLSLHC